VKTINYFLLTLKNKSIRSKPD